MPWYHGDDPNLPQQLDTLRKMGIKEMGNYETSQLQTRLKGEENKRLKRKLLFWPFLVCMSTKFCTEPPVSKKTEVSLKTKY